MSRPEKVSKDHYRAGSAGQCTVRAALSDCDIAVRLQHEPKRVAEEGVIIRDHHSQRIAVELKETWC